MKTKKDLLASFMRRNKEAREKMALNAGFDSASSFKAHLLRGMKRDESKVEEVIDEIEKPSTTKELSSEETPQHKLDMVIAFDTTGSMASYIGAVRKRVEEVAENLFKNTTDLRISVVAFGDYCDMANANIFGKAYQCLPLSTSANEVINFIKGAENTYGGDGDEFYELVIKRITEETEWRADAKKSVLLIGDAGPHEVGYSYGYIISKAQIDWKIEAEKSADLGIQWDTFRIHSHTQWYQELSKITGGVSLPFSSAENTSDVVEGLAYKRAGATAAYSTMAMQAEESGDSELIGTFKSISTLD